nr:hypothetical protein [Vibrio cyclitrophicus]PMK95188.1 hypothetical protein BCT87_13075 [Vibrio cyclitrophicus]
MTKLIHFPYCYRQAIVEKAEKNLRQRYKENDLLFEYASFIMMVTPLLESLGIKAEGNLNSSYNDGSANRVAALVTEILWIDMRMKNVHYLSPQLD